MQLKLWGREPRLAEDLHRSLGQLRRNEAV